MEKIPIGDFAKSSSQVHEDWSCTSPSRPASHHRAAKTLWRRRNTVSENCKKDCDGSKQQIPDCLHTAASNLCDSRDRAGRADLLADPEIVPHSQHRFENIDDDDSSLHSRKNENRNFKTYEKSGFQNKKSKHGRASNEEERRASENCPVLHSKFHAMSSSNKNGQKVPEREAHEVGHVERKVQFQSEIVGGNLQGKIFQRKCKSKVRRVERQSEKARGGSLQKKTSPTGPLPSKGCDLIQAMPNINSSQKNRARGSRDEIRGCEISKTDMEIGMTLSSAKRKQREAEANGSSKIICGETTRSAMWKKREKAPDAPSAGKSSPSANDSLASSLKGLPPMQACDHPPADAARCASLAASTTARIIEKTEMQCGLAKHTASGQNCRMEGFSPVNRKYGSPVNQRYGSPVNQKYGTAFNQQYGTAVNQQYGTAVNQQYGTAVNQQYGTAVNQQYGTAVNQQYGTAVNHNGGNDDMKFYRVNSAQQDILELCQEVVERICQGDAKSECWGDPQSGYESDSPLYEVLDGDLCNVRNNFLKVRGSCLNDPISLHSSSHREQPVHQKHVANLAQIMPEREADEYAPDNEMDIERKGSESMIFRRGMLGSMICNDEVMLQQSPSASSPGSAGFDLSPSQQKWKPRSPVSACMDGCHIQLRLTKPCIGCREADGAGAIKEMLDHDCLHCPTSRDWTFKELRDREISSQRLIDEDHNHIKPTMMNPDDPPLSHSISEGRAERAPDKESCLTESELSQRCSDSRLYDGRRSTGRSPVQSSRPINQKHGFVNSNWTLDGSSFPFSKRRLSLNGNPKGKHITSIDKFVKRFSNISVGYVDSHCHLDFLFKRMKFDGSIQAFIDRHKETFPSNFDYCVANFCDPKEYTHYELDGKAFWIECLEHPKVYGSIGVHPKKSSQLNQDMLMKMTSMLAHPKVLSVGEIGLDYSGYFCKEKVLQKDSFRRQLQLSIEVKKPLVIHCREADDDCLAIMQECIPRETKIHRHCFTEAQDVAQKWLNAFPNLFLGFTGLITYSGVRSKAPREVVSNIPLHRIIIETDAPYFLPSDIQKADLPVSHPGLVILVAAEIAKLKAISLSEVLTIVRKNTYSMYGV